MDEILRVNPELKAVQVNVHRIQVPEAANPAGSAALSSQRLQEDVPGAPGDAEDFVRAGAMAAGRKVAASGAASIVAMFQLESTRMEEQLGAR